MQAAVDGQGERRPRLGFSRQCGIVAVLLDVGVDALQAGAARQIVLEGELNAGAAAVARVVAIHGAGSAHNMRRQLPVRIEAPHFLAKLNPIELPILRQFAHTGGFLRVDFAFDPQKAAGTRGGRGKPVIETRAIDLENARQQIGRHAQVGNLGRIHADRFGGQTLGQRLSAAIEDRTAYGLDLD